MPGFEHTSMEIDVSLSVTPHPVSRTFTPHLFHHTEVTIGRHSSSAKWRELETPLLDTAAIEQVFQIGKRTDPETVGGRCFVGEKEHWIHLRANRARRYSGKVIARPVPLVEGPSHPPDLVIEVLCTNHTSHALVGAQVDQRFAGISVSDTSDQPVKKRTHD